MSQTDDQSIFIDKAIEFCQYMQFLYNDEPIWIQFEITTVFIKFWVYCNTETFDVFDEFIEEMDAGLNSYALIEEGMGKFYARLSTVHENIDYEFCWEFISININILDFAKNSVQ